MEPAPKLPPKPVREQAKVLYAYEAQNDDELTIKEGDIITILAKEIEDQGWYKGELNGRIGVFPDNFVECIRLTEDERPAPRRPGGPPPPPSSSASSSSSTSTPKVAGKPFTLVDSTGPPPPPAPKFLKSNSTTDGNVSSSTSTTPANKSSETSSILRNSGIFGLPKKVTKTGAALLGASSKSNSTKPHLTHSVSVDSDHSDHSNNNNNNNTNNNNNDCGNFSGIDSGVKLSHPTANRPKGPSNRRPPSYIASPSSTTGKEDADISIENGDSPIASTNGTASNGSIHATPGQSKTCSIGNTTIEPVSRTSNSVTSPGNKGNKEDPPPWMVELRKTQELKRTKTIDTSSPVVTEKCITSSNDNEASNYSLPPRASNRASGDFSARLSSFTPSNSGANHLNSTDAPATTATVASSILKPTKPAKPNTTAVATANATSNATSPTSASSATFTPRESSATVANCNAPGGATSSITSKSTADSTGTASDIYNSPIVIDLQRELKYIKETCVPKKDFDELAKQVAQLKELFDAQSKSKSKTIKELINDLAEERKKLSALQIEVDRLRKLNAA